jgi:hypothetical protein
VGDIDNGVVDSLKAPDLKRPIREEADMAPQNRREGRIKTIAPPDHALSNKHPSM